MTSPLAFTWRIIRLTVSLTQNARVRSDSRAALLHTITQLGAVIRETVVAINASATRYGLDRDGARTGVGGVARSAGFLNGLRSLLLYDRIVCLVTGARADV